MIDMVREKGRLRFYGGNKKMKWEGWTGNKCNRTIVNDYGFARKVDEVEGKELV